MNQHSVIRFLIGRRPGWTLTRILILLSLTFFVFKFAMVPLRVEGNSMDPTYYDGQICFLNTLAYNWDQPRRGDVVGFRLETNGPIIIKRIVGLPGERIVFHRGVVFINSQRLAEPYLASPGAWEWPEETLGEKDFFVTGDNRIISQQFRINSQKIMGRIYRWHP